MPFSDAAVELALYIDNDQRAYSQKEIIFRSLARKKERGTYKTSLAPRAFAALTNVAAKKYIREFGSPADRWNTIFSPMDRRQAAVQLAGQFESWYETDYQTLKGRS